MGAKNWSAREDGLVVEAFPLEGDSPKMAALAGRRGDLENLATNLGRGIPAVNARWYTLRNIKAGTTRKGKGKVRDAGALDAALKALDHAIDDALLGVLATLPLTEKVALLRIMARELPDAADGLKDLVARLTVLLPKEG